MFTGIIEGTGQISLIETQGDAARYTIETPTGWLNDTAVGDSIAVDGVCLTVISFNERQFIADVSAETLSCTTLKDLAQHSVVNLEKAMKATGRFGGHFVSGHVDGIGKIVQFDSVDDSILLGIQAPISLMHYIAKKGSVTINGVSLTVNTVASDIFTINLINYTIRETSFQFQSVGGFVNIEVDLIARYLERLMLASTDTSPESSNISTDFLARCGFIHE